MQLIVSIPFYYPKMLFSSRIKRPISLFLVFTFTLCLILLPSLTWVNAQERPTPKLQEWHISGIIAALDDSYPQVQVYALKQLAKYEAQDLKIVLKKPEDIVRKVVNLLIDETVDLQVRGSAADSLGNLGDFAKPYVKDIADLLKDKTVDPQVRGSAADALGQLGDAAKPYVKDIADILKDQNLDSRVRYSAARGLGNLGDFAKPYVKDIADILKDQNLDSEVRASAAYALGNLGYVAKPYVKDIADILKDQNFDSRVRISAVYALGNLGDFAKPYVKDIVNILKNKNLDSEFRSSAAYALGNLGDGAKPYVKDILEFLKNKNLESFSRANASQTLKNLGDDVVKTYIKDILEFLKDKTIDQHIRATLASNTLEALNDSAEPYLKDIVELIKDKTFDLSVRSSLVRALGNLEDAAKPYVKDIADLLKDKTLDSGLRSSAAQALGNLDDAAKPYVKDIANLLKDKTIDLWNLHSVAQALGNLRQLELEDLPLILDNVYYHGYSNIPQWRWLTYFLSGGTDEVKTLLQWLGYPQTTPEKLIRSQGVKTLELFLKVWQISTREGLTELRDDLAEKIAVVAANKNVPWQPQDITLLQQHYNNLNAVKSTHADKIQSLMIKLKGWLWFFNFSNIILIHAAFWLALIFAYPKSPQIQAIFFWNPWVRKILGMGYVGFFLTWVPFLRGKLLEPFQPSLLADAALDRFNSATYFPESCVKPPASDGTVPITTALPNLKGQIVLEGDSGLGKSMFLRHLLKHTSDVAVYLPAYKCEQGVIKAIQDKLHGQAQDVKFLKSLIYSGAIDIYIDGLNEVTADTRSQIKQFVESYFRCHVIMTTQTLQWEPPSTAKTFILKPLTKEQITQFLLSRSLRLPANAKIKDEEYKKACKNYLEKILNPQQPATELEANYGVLSNPMDLTLISQMLSQGEHPDLFRLQEQQYNLMAQEYKQEWKHDFPLKRFSQRVYQQRINDENAIPADEFDQEVLSMEDQKYKMIVSRQWENKYGQTKKEWYFRHDKIMEFFLVQNFLDTSLAAKERQTKHMSDPRFRGVYFLLAKLLPLDEAQELRENLIQYAVDTKDHTVMDTYVQ